MRFCHIKSRPPTRKGPADRGAPLRLHGHTWEHWVFLCSPRPLPPAGPSAKSPRRLLYFSRLRPPGDSAGCRRCSPSPWSPHCCAPPRAVQLRPGCEAWCRAPRAPHLVCARRQRVTTGWRAGLVIWGSASRHLCRWHGRVLQRNREEGTRRDGGGSRGGSKPGWDGNKANSKAGNKKEAVRVISGGRLPPGLPASCPHQPPHSPPTPYPAPALPFYSERHSTVCARVLFVTVRQRGLSGSWPPRPAATVTLPGPGAPLASG